MIEIKDMTQPRLPWRGTFKLAGHIFSFEAFSTTRKGLIKHMITRLIEWKREIELAIIDLENMLEEDK